MIVVAIIGILAAVAIPGFMSYIRSSKTSEAKTNLDAVRKGALSFFEAEHYDATGMKSITKQYPDLGGAASTATAVGDNSTVGFKNDPTATATVNTLNAAPWNLLNFKISAPFYYKYSYDAISSLTNGKVTDTSTQAASRFMAGACASLSEANDSGYTITGLSTGSVGATVEAGSLGTCPTVTAPASD